MLLHPSTSAMFAAAGMLSADGRCKALDAAADGYTRGEACVTLAVESAAAAAAVAGFDATETVGTMLSAVASPAGHGCVFGRGVLIVVRFFLFFFFFGRIICAAVDEYIFPFPANIKKSTFCK